MNLINLLRSIFSIECRKTRWQDELCFVRSQIIQITRELYETGPLYERIHNSAIDKDTPGELSRHRMRKNEYCQNENLLKYYEKRKRYLEKKLAA